MEKYMVITNRYGDLDTDIFDKKEEAKKFFKEELDKMLGAEESVDVYNHNGTDVYSRTWKECIEYGIAVLCDTHSIKIVKL